MVNVINNFNVVLETRGYIEYLIYKNKIVVCEFPALYTLQNLGFNIKRGKSELNHVLSIAQVGYAKLSVSTPDRLHFKIPLTGLKADDRIRFDALWLAQHLEKQFDLQIHVEIIHDTGKIVTKSQVANANFFNIIMRSFL